MLDLFPSREAGRFGRRRKHARGAKLPVIVVTGFLGAGKTTLLRRFLGSPAGEGTAVVINGAGARFERRCHAAWQRLPVLQHALRPAERIAQSPRRARAWHGAAIQTSIDRDERARRSWADLADVRHGSRAGQRISRRDSRGRNRGRERARNSGMVGRGKKAGHPCGPAGRLQNRSRRTASAQAIEGTPYGAQSARRRSRRGRGPSRSALSARERYALGEDRVRVRREAEHSDGILSFVITEK